MMLLGCLHPPSGAVALTAVLGGPAIRSLGYTFVAWPVGLNSLLLLVCALIFNNVTGRTYPHAAPVESRNDVGSGAAMGAGLNAADIDAALAQFDEVLDILEAGAAKARAIAEKKMAVVRDAVGIL